MADLFKDNITMLYSVVQSLYSVCVHNAFLMHSKKANCFHGTSKYHKVYIVEKKNIIYF